MDAVFSFFGLLGVAFYPLLLISLFAWTGATQAAHTRNYKTAGRLALTALVCNVLITVTQLGLCGIKLAVGNLGGALLQGLLLALGLYATARSYDLWKTLK